MNLTEAELVYNALESGEWSVVRHQPVSYLTDEANEMHKWSVQRTTVPYCGKDGVRIWCGPTPSAALEAARRSLRSK